MAQPQKKQKQPPDAYGQRGKTLTSSVQRLRGWVGSDPARLPDLADALVELTAHRLLGHSFSGAASDAQEAVRHAAQLLTANGPIGPYTSAADAARVVTAVVHLAVIQAAAGMPAVAGRTVESLGEMQQQLSALRLEEQLEPRTAIWALSTSARAALDAGQIAAANAYADAARDRLLESGLRDDADAAHLVLDVDRLVSDARWAAGETTESLTGLHAAMDRYNTVVGGRLDEPGRLSPAVLERLAGPIFGLYRDLADRLAATGETDLALVTRRELVAILEGLTPRLGDSARAQLGSALSDLATNLLAADRADEAEAASAKASALLPVSPQTASSLVVAAVRAQTLTRIGRSGEAVALMRQVLPTDDGSPSAGRALGLIALADALSAAGDAGAAESTERVFAEAAREVVGSAVGGRSVRSRVQDLARGIVSRGDGPVSWDPLPLSASYAATTASPASSGLAGDVGAGTDAQDETAAWLVAERTEAHRREQELLEQARVDGERREVARAEAERAAAQQREAAEAEAARTERLDAERRTAAEEAERLAIKARRQERLEAHRLEMAEQERERRELELLETERLRVEPVEPEHNQDTRQDRELDHALQEWRDARARGDRRGARTANERVAELLRPRSAADPDQYGPQLVEALEELSSARLRGGDLWGSRAPAKEARALAKALGR